MADLQLRIRGVAPPNLTLGGANDTKCWGVAKPSTLDDAMIVPHCKIFVTDLRIQQKVFICVLLGLDCAKTGIWPAPALKYGR